MRLWFLLIGLGAAPSGDQIVTRWPDGGPSKVRTWAGGVVVKETYFFTTGALWSEISRGDGGLSLSYDTDGWLKEETPVNAEGSADGVSRKFQRDGGLVARGALTNGLELGEWRTWFENGSLSSHRVYRPAGTLESEITWVEEGWKQTERRPGVRLEFEPDGGLRSRMTGTRLETFAAGRRLEEREGSLLLNSWGADGGPEIRDGAGTRMEFDGELGTQHRVRYSGGKVVRQR